MKKPVNPIAARVEAMAGRKLQPDWQQNLETTGGTFDRRKLEDMWKNPQWSSKINSENVIRDARLSTWKETLGEK
jgi:hypothetical protein